MTQHSNWIPKSTTHYLSAIRLYLDGNVLQKGIAVIAVWSPEQRVQFSKTVIYFGKGCVSYKLGKIEVVRSLLISSIDGSVVFETVIDESLQVTQFSIVDTCFGGLINWGTFTLICLRFIFIYKLN